MKRSKVENHQLIKTKKLRVDIATLFFLMKLRVAKVRQKAKFKTNQEVSSQNS